MMKYLIFSITAVLILSCGGSETPKAEADSGKKVEAAPVVDNIAAGEKIFRTYCVTCHGVDGKLGLNGAKDLTASTISMEERITQVTKGKGLMTPFEGILNEEQIKQVTEYTASMVAK